MGAAQSQVDPRYARIWNNLTSIQSVEARIQMLDTLLSAPEYVAVAKRVGVYASLLQWSAATRRGEYAHWPGTSQQPQQQPQLHQSQQQSHQSQQPPTLRITDVHSRPQTNSALARIPPPKRALDVLNESYTILGIDDSKPLTHEALKLAYKRAALRVHPDKGGSPEAFDAVTKAFLYVQEVLNKLIPKTATDGNDVRFTAPVTMDSALRARGVQNAHVAPAPPGTVQIEDRPPVALNPKKLDMAVFNKLFEENKLPDLDKDDGYGDWLKSQDTSRAIPQNAMRGKYNTDVFNKTFEDEARKLSATAPQNTLAKYTTPSELTLAPNFGAELGSGRPAMYTKAPASGGIGYTDLKHAYGEGSTFSQDVANVNLDGRPKNLEEAKREYNSAPRALTADEAAAVASFERAKEAAESQRRRRAAAQDVDAETAHTRMKSRLMIQQ